MSYYDPLDPDHIPDRLISLANFDSLLQTLLAEMDQVGPGLPEGPIALSDQPVDWVTPEAKQLFALAATPLYCLVHPPAAEGINEVLRAVWRRAVTRLDSTVAVRSRAFFQTQPTGRVRPVRHTLPGISCELYIESQLVRLLAAAMASLLSHLSSGVSRGIPDGRLSVSPVSLTATHDASANLRMSIGFLQLLEV